MKTAILNTLAGRTIMVLLLGFAISHIASLLVYTAESGAAVNLLRDRLVAERIAMVTRLVERTPEAERAELLAVIDSPGLRVAERAQGGASESNTEGQRPHVLEHMLRLYLGDRPDESVSVEFLAAADDGKIDALFGPEDRALQGHSEDVRRFIESEIANTTIAGTIKTSVRLADSDWLVFSSPLNMPKPYSYRLVLSLAIMLVAVLGFSVWAVRRWTAPLTAFAHAAERLGVDVNAPPLPETGLLEVRRAARAFNQMQERIRRFVEDRVEMVAAIAHDLGTPITRLRLRAEYVDDEAQHAKMLSDLSEMETMIASTLAFARDEGANEPRETFDLNSLLQGICDDFADAGHLVEFHPHGRLPWACRLVAFRRALTNLIENAVKYGTAAHLAVSAGADSITIRIDDDGPGIPEALRDEVFKPFRRLEASRSRETGGTGLGLTVARTIVRAHGGDIALSNRSGGGLRVEVKLPR